MDHSTSSPLRTISHEVSEFEFHISPARNSSRPQTGVGTSGTSSSRRRAQAEIVAQAARAVDRLGDVGDDAVAPAAHLVPEEPEAAGGRAPTAPSATTPRSADSPDQTGAISIT